jgi:hypothetical protein
VSTRRRLLPLHARRACATVVALLSLVGAGARAGTTPASTTVAIDRARVPLGDGLLVAEGGDVPDHLVVQTALFLTYALHPLVLRDGGGDVVGGLVDHRVNAHVVASVGLLDVATVGIDVPLALLQLGGDVPSALAAVTGATSGLAGAGLGDVRVVPKVRLLDRRRHGVSLALLPVFTLPTSAAVRFASTGTTLVTGSDSLGEGGGAFTFSPELALSGRWGPVHPVVDVAWRLRPPARFLGVFAVEPELLYRAGVAVDVGDAADERTTLAITAELFGATADANPFGLVGNADPAQVRLQNPLEVLVGARWRHGGLRVDAGVGTGLLSGIGSPDLRVIVGARWSLDPPDADGDGVAGAHDLCPDGAEDRDGHDDGDGCPDDDNDADGIADRADRCPARAEDVDAVDDDDGCPDDDNDADGVPDDDDACRDQPGPADARGCPPAEAITVPTPAR